MSPSPAPLGISPELAAAIPSRTGASPAEQAADMFGESGAGPAAYATATAVTHLRFLSRVEAQAPELYQHGARVTSLHDLDAAMQSFTAPGGLGESAQPEQAAEAWRNTRDVIARGMVDSRIWLTDLQRNLGDAAVSALRHGMAPADVAARLDGVFQATDHAVAASGIAPDAGQSFRIGLRQQVGSRLEDAALSTAAWRDTVTRNEEGHPVKVSTSNPAADVIHRLTATPTRAGRLAASFPIVDEPWTPAAAPNAPQGHPIKRALASTLAAATVMFGNSPRALLHRAEHVADTLGTLEGRYYEEDLVPRIADLTARMRQWGPQEWAEVPREKAEDLAFRLGAAKQPDLADLFHQHALSTPRPGQSPRPQA